MGKWFLKSTEYTRQLARLLIIGAEAQRKSVAASSMLSAAWPQVFESLIAARSGKALVARTLLDPALALLHDLIDVEVAAGATEGDKLLEALCLTVDFRGFHGIVLRVS